MCESLLIQSIFAYRICIFTHAIPLIHSYKHNARESTHFHPHRRNEYWYFRIKLHFRTNQDFSRKSTISLFLREKVTSFAILSLLSSTIAFYTALQCALAQIYLLFWCIIARQSMSFANVTIKTVNKIYTRPIPWISIIRIISLKSRACHWNRIHLKSLWAGGSWNWFDRCRI